MNIQSIQIAQGLLTRAGEGKVNSAKGNPSAENNVSVQDISLPEAKENKILPENSNLSNTKGNAFEIFYPPFFPMGNTQGIYTVMMDAKPAKEPSSEPVQVQKTDQKTDETNVKAASAESMPVVREKDIRIESSPSELEQASKPGSVLDLKV